jgi:hypothetical protein
MPKSKFKSFWNALIMIFLVYTGTYVPFKVAFLNTDNSLIENFMELIIDCIFMFDIVVNFISAYEDRECNIEHRLSKIALSYITSWFLLDVFSSIPYQLINNNDESGGGSAK